MPNRSSHKIFSSYNIRKIILEQSKRANVGHIGSALSIADILLALYGRILRIKNPQDHFRDRFILSKGHAALSLYAVLFLKGWISQKQLNTFCADGTLLGVHPDHAVCGIDFSTGSLGQGLSVAAGVALGARLKKASYRSFALISDAECNEGSVWEAAMFAGHHRLSNLIVVLDQNGQQAFGYTRDVIRLKSIGQTWASLGWDVHEIDGHNIAAMVKLMGRLKINEGRPHLIVAKTTFGKGVSYMENKIKWHYWPMSDEEYEIALKDIEKFKGAHAV